MRPRPATSSPSPASTKFNVADTLCAPDVTEPLQAQPIDPPTLSMTFLVNDSPLAGTEGDKVTSRVIRARLMREAEGNVALRVADLPGGESFDVSPAAANCSSAILIETMRREGFELGVSRPKVVLQKDESGQLLEPIEEVVIDVDEEHSGVVVQKMAERKAEMIEMRPSGGDRLRLVFHAPTRGLIGYQSELMTDTRGTAIINRLFHEYAPYKGEIAGRRNGVLISNDQGESVAYAMWKLEDRGPMMIEPGQKVYRGMIVGEHTRDNDLEINVLKGKQLTNIRAAGKDEAVRLTPPIKMPLEQRARLYRGRGTRRGDAEVDPPAQGDSRPDRPQACRAGQGKRLGASCPAPCGASRPSGSSASPRKRSRRFICWARKIVSSACPATRCARPACDRKSRASRLSPPPIFRKSWRSSPTSFSAFRTCKPGSPPN